MLKLKLKGAAAGVALVVAAAALSLAWWASRPESAEAHALLVQSDPAQNSELTSPPQIVFGIFSEQLDTRLSRLEVVDGRGERVDDGKVTFGPEPERMSVGIEGTLPPGYYAVNWETLSAVDGHVFKGSYPFTVLNEDGSQPSGPRPDISGGGGYGATVPKVIVKWALILGGTALVGGLAFVLGVSAPSRLDAGPELRTRARGAVRRAFALLAWPALAALAAGAGGELLLQAHQLGGLEFIGDSLRNDWGERWIQRQIVLAGMAAAIGVAVLLWRDGRERLSDWALGVALAGGVVYLLLVAMVSHGNAVPGSFWAVGADFLHLVASSAWVGMLVMLALFLLWLRGDPGEGSERAGLFAGYLQRFSTLAATSVVVLLATGAANGLAQVPDVGSLADTAYGRSLTLKLVLMAGLLAVAAANAFLLRPRAVDEVDEGAVTEATQRRLQKLVWLEFGLALAVLAAAAVLIQYPTSRQLDQVAAAKEQAEAQAVIGYEEIQPAGDLQVNLTVSPNSVGPNAYRVFLFPGEGGDIGEVLRVRLRFQKQGEEAVSELVLEPAGVNAWRGAGPFFTSAGGWTVHVDVRRAEADDVTADFPVNVQASATGAGGQFDYPLTRGTWVAVAGVVVLVLALLAAVWMGQWPDFPEAAPRLMRVGISAFSVIGIGLFVIGLLPTKEPVEGNPIDQSPESIALGRQLYAANCQQCHGVSGRGDGPLAPELPVAPADFRIHIPYHQDEFFFQVMTFGLGTIMPGFGDQLTEDERWHLLNFLKSEFGAVNDIQASSTPGATPDGTDSP